MFAVHRMRSRGDSGSAAEGGDAIGHAFGVRVDGASPRGLWPPDGGGLCRRVVKRKVLKMDGPSAQGFLSLTALRAEGCGGALGHTFGVRVLKMDRPDGRKVLKFDGAFGPEGCGLPFGQ